MTSVHRPWSVLIAVLKDNNANVRGSAAEALGQIGAVAVEPLIAVLKDKDVNVRKSAAEALGQIGDTRAVEPLITMLKDIYGVCAERLRLRH